MPAGGRGVYTDLPLKGNAIKMQNNFAFTIAWPNLARSLDTDIGISEPTLPNQAIDPNFQPVFYHGIWDTGATGSVITENVAKNLNLKPIGMTLVSTAGGQVLQNEYFVNIYLPNKIYVPNVKVTEGKLSNIDILIGMDIISLGDFSVTNHEGKTVMSFRMPSCHIVDYVKDNELLKLPRHERKRLAAQKKKELFR